MDVELSDKAPEVEISLAGLVPVPVEPGNPDVELVKGNGASEACELLVDCRPLEAPAPIGGLLLGMKLVGKSVLVDGAPPVPEGPVAPGIDVVEFGNGYGPDELLGANELKGKAEVPVPGAVEPPVGPASEVGALLPVPKGAVLTPEPVTGFVLFGKG